MSSVILLGVEPIRVVTDGARDAAGASFWLDWLVPGLVVLGVAGIALLAIRVVPTLGLDRDPGERAFRALARKLRLGRPHRATLRTLAAQIDAPPVALLLCRSAFVRAIGRREAEGHTDVADRSRLLELEHRLFG